MFTLKLFAVAFVYLIAVLIAAVLLPFAYAGYQMARAWRGITRLT